MQKNYSLLAYNTFGIAANARYFQELNHFSQLAQLSELPSFFDKRLILGGGSNILLSQDFDGIVIHNNLRGIERVKESNNHVFVKALAGEVWQDLVTYAINNNLAGLENLSLIPGRVGASPMQNIGAYGVELKDVFEELEAWNIAKQQIEVFKNDACHFGYRESIFKNEAKDRYIILSVTYKLSKEPKINASYGDIERTLKEMGVENPTIKDISAAVIAIRSAKLPNPAEIGNAGSFFKNPVIANEQLAGLKAQYATIPHYVVDANNSKVPAGWLIEQAGWKGKTLGNYGVHKNQALVLVNYGGAKGEDIIQLAYKIQEDVKTKFGVEINPEVNFV